MENLEQSQIEALNKFSTCIMKLFPSLNQNIVHSLSKMILNKLIDGVEYPKEWESKIEEIYPLLIESLNQNKW